MQRAYILEPGAYLRKTGENLTIFREGAPVGEIPLHGLQHLTLMGCNSLSGGVLDALIKHQRPSGRIDRYDHGQRPLLSAVPGLSEGLRVFWGWRAA